MMSHTHGPSFVFSGCCRLASGHKGTGSSDYDMNSQWSRSDKINWTKLDEKSANELDFRLNRGLAREIMIEYDKMFL